MKIGQFLTDNPTYGFYLIAVTIDIITAALGSDIKLTTIVQTHLFFVFP